MCGFCNVWVCACVGFVMCGCFGNMCTCIYCFVLFVLCFCIVSFTYIYSKLTWAEGIRGLMGEKGLMEGDWNNRGNRRKKIL